MNIKDLQKQSHCISLSKGFYDREVMSNSHLFFIVTKLALVMTEISECIEGVRQKGITENFSEELADAVIRIADLAEYLNIDLEEVIAKKTAINSERPQRHNKRF